MFKLLPTQFDNRPRVARVAARPISLTVGKGFIPSQPLFLVSWMVICLISTIAAGADRTLRFSHLVTNNTVRFFAPPDVASYYALEHSIDLRTFTPIAMSLAESGPEWSYFIPPGTAPGFFRFVVLNIFDPDDIDDDDIDDLYELRHPDRLSPFNPADANSDSGQDGKSNYELYLCELFGGMGVTMQFFSHEVSAFNLGAPTARLEAISPEVTVYNAHPGSGLPSTDLAQVFSREVSAWNFGSLSTRLEAISHEVSVYNANPGSAPPPTDLGQVFSREASVWNFGSPSARLAAISREVSLFNFGAPTANLEAISRELSVLNLFE